MSAFLINLFNVLGLGTMGIVARFLAELKQLGATVNQNKTVAQFVIGFNATVAGNKIVPIINSYSFPEAEHFLVTGMRVYEGANAALGSTAWTPGVSDAIACNGRLSIVNNGSTVIKDMPLTTFQAGDYAEAGFANLSKPIMWKAQTELSGNLNFDTAPATSNLNLRLEFWGVKCI